MSPKAESCLECLNIRECTVGGVLVEHVVVVLSGVYPGEHSSDGCSKVFSVPSHTHLLLQWYLF